MRILARAARDEAGATAVELALTLSIFTMMLLGGLDYGLYLWTANALQQTAIQTVRCMGVLQSDCTIQRTVNPTKTRNFAQGLASAYGVTLTTNNFTFNTATSCGGVGTDNSQVTITYTYAGVTPILPGVPSTMTAQACFPNRI